jgi:hypothetical protein
MNKELSNKHGDNKDSRPQREYSGIQELANNLPYGIMIGLGTAILLVGFGNSTPGWTAASVYLLYGVAGVLWIMIFLCPHCPFFNTRSCPCGYGRIAARLRSKRDDDSFKRKFKRHIPVIAPLWFIPVVASVFPLWGSFSWPLLILLIVFALDAFVVLPLFSRKHGCTECPQKDLCPWMAGNDAG